MLHELESAEGDRDGTMDRLVRRYWAPIYAYIRRTGRNVHEASDLTQGFFATVILERQMPRRADRARGRFRALLLTSLQNYLHERHRHEARRRLPAPSRATAYESFDIDAAEGRNYETPEAAFSYHWSASLVRAVLDKVRIGCVRDGLEMHWAVFDARVGRALLFGENPPSMAELVERLDLTSAPQASNMLVTVKRRFAKVLREEIAATVAGGPEEVEAELCELLKDLERRK